jgi:galactokinase/mevalonate kinase-like predicted kinase
MPEDLRLWNAAIKRFPLPADGVRVEWESEIPRSSGISGSTALLASTLAAVLEIRGEPPDVATAEGRSAFAELVRDVERHDAGVMCGYQDAYMIVHGGIQLMDFAGKHPVEAGPPARLEAIDAPLPFLLITTGVERLSGSVHGPMSERWMGGERLVVESIAEISNLAAPGAAALVSGDYRSLAEAMNANQSLIRELGGSGDSVDLLVERAMRHGAMAAKLAGAGMGGTIIALTEDPAGLEARLRDDGYTRFIAPKSVPGVQIGGQGPGAGG